MTLEAWLAHRWVTAHETSLSEIADLLAVVDRDLEDAAIDGLSPDRRLGIAYSAALQLATLALAAAGYRPGRDRGHERALLSLRFTVGLSQDLVDTLDAVRRKRNQTSYERAGTTSVSEAMEVFDVARELRRTVLAWLGKFRPELLP